MAISKEEVLKVARLARIGLSQEEVELFSKQLESILGFIDQLKEAGVSGVSPMNHILNIQNVVRTDTPGVSLIRDLTFQNAPQKAKGHFQVPKVIE